MSSGGEWNVTESHTPLGGIMRCYGSPWHRNNFPEDIIYNTDMREKKISGKSQEKCLGKRNISVEKHIGRLIDERTVMSLEN